MATVNPLTLVLLATIGIGMTAALLAWRERTEPGAKPLVAMLAGQCWWSAFLIFQLEATTLEAKQLWISVSWLGVVVIPVAWLLFALEYTGRDEYVNPRNVALLSILPATTVVVALTGDYHSLLYVDSKLVEWNGTVTISQRGGIWFWAIAGYTYLLGFLGSIPLLGLVRSDALPFRGQSAALLVGTVAPWASNALFLAGVVPSTGLDPTPIAFSISGVAYLGALTRFRLLGTSPSPNQRARRLVFKRMQEGAIVVDSHDYVVDMNESAAETLGVSPRAALGSPAVEIIPRYETLPDDGPAPGHITIEGAHGNRPYDATVTQIHDSHGRLIGRVVTFHDVSEHLRQQQRLEVLNRVLRHNIRNEANLIFGYADLMANGSAESANIVKERAMNIAEMGEKARQITDLFDRGNSPLETVSLAVLLPECVSAVRETHPEVDVDCGPIPEGVQVASVLDAVLSNLVENAAEHNTSDDPHVWIRVETDEEAIRVVVADDGPGITEYERGVLERGTESPLQHGSGLGLWLVTWGAGIAGGTVTFAENEPTGSIVTVEVPSLSNPEREVEPAV